MGGHAGTEGSKGAICRHLCKEKEGGETGIQCRANRRRKVVSKMRQKCKTGIQCRGINIQCAGTILVSATKLRFMGSYSDVLRSSHRLKSAGALKIIINPLNLNFNYYGRN